VPAGHPPPCVTEASCKAAPTPQPSIFGLPASATFSGAGNLGGQALNPPPPPGKPTAAQLRAKQLAKALKACRTDKHKRKRLACEKQARKRYGATKAKRSNNHTGSK